MLLRICLIIALAGGLAVGVVNFVKVKAVITNTIAERDSEKTAKLAAQDDAKKTHATLKTTQAKLDTTTRELAQTKTELEEANGKVTDLQKQNGELAAHLKETQAARDKSDQELSKWTQLNVTPQQVIQTIADLKKTIAERDQFIAENQLLNKKNVELKDELATLTGKEENPPLPAGLKGKIVAVDPKYAFVVLDIGDDKGVVPRAVMLVARDGKFIGKVQISKVEGNQSIANIMPAWRQGPIMEGDQVLY
ncbi:MAG: hypothetical protein ABSF38_19340 [Verrucomicrobiota bacterium]|jgi:predicted RNase H-like nuclease (RuvC/YqgF family)